MKLASRFFIFCTLLFSVSAQAKLLDKIAAIVDDNIITLSQVKRARANLAIKKSVASMIYDKASYTDEEMLNVTINRYLMRAKLSELGYNISDDVVEAQIKQNEERLRVDRASLLVFLKQQGTSFDEYFETLREAIEFSYFVNRVISPIVSVSDQDIKNAYYKRNIKDNRLNFKYTLIDYYIGTDVIARPSKGQLEEVVKQYRTNGVLPEEYSTLNVVNLDDIAEEGLTAELRNALKNTDEGSMTSSILLNGAHHVFFIAKKDLVETSAYLAQKEKIKDELFEAAVRAEKAVWFEREKNKHYIKISL